LKRMRARKAQLVSEGRASRLDGLGFGSIRDYLKDRYLGKARTILEMASELHVSVPLIRQTIREAGLSKHGIRDRDKRSGRHGG
ncbi:MAG: hypothetical protein ACREEC_13770, partial [Thermoplasmata archaeon]